jgi:hypothetical protein
MKYHIVNLTRQRFLADSGPETWTQYRSRIREFESKSEAKDYIEGCMTFPCLNNSPDNLTIRKL